MTPAGRLQVAIDKLEKFKAESTPGPWSVNVHHNAMHTAEFRAPNPFNGFMLVAAHTNDADPELVVALHRTIDPQLAILRDVLAAEKVERHWDTLVYTTNALALADAILGGEA